jgi:hypothetical protein
LIDVLIDEYLIAEENNNALFVDGKSLHKILTLDTKLLISDHILYKDISELISINILIVEEGVNLLEVYLNAENLSIICTKNHLVGFGANLCSPNPFGSFKDVPNKVTLSCENGTLAISTTNKKEFGVREPINGENIKSNLPL